LAPLYVFELYSNYALDTPGEVQTAMFTDGHVSVIPIWHERRDCAHILVQNTTNLKRHNQMQKHVVFLIDMDLSLNRDASTKERK
jgi:hypothetical protein